MLSSSAFEAQQDHKTYRGFFHAYHFFLLLLHVMCGEKMPVKSGSDIFFTIHRPISIPKWNQYYSFLFLLRLYVASVDRKHIDTGKVGPETFNCEKSRQTKADRNVKSKKI